MAKFRTSIAVAWAILVGAMTLGVGWLLVPSVHPTLQIMKLPLTILLFPGLYGSTILGSLWPGAGINALIHLALSWLILYMVFYVRKRRA